jgi:hypothetical protein
MYSGERRQRRRPVDEATVRLYFTVDGEHLAAIQLLEIRA